MSTVQQKILIKSSYIDGRYEFESIFINLYIEQTVRQLSFIFKKSKEELELIVKEKLYNEYKELIPKYRVVERDQFNTDTETNILEVLDYLENEKPIITGFGALYQQHKSGTKNILLDMVQMLLDVRKVYKKKKFEHANDEDKSLYQLFDNYQLTYKLLNNSFFGAAGQPQSIFFDPYLPQSIMYTGQIIIMTAIVTFEKLSGNFQFYSMEDFTHYIEQVKTTKLDAELDLDIIPSREDLYNLLISKFEDTPYNEFIVKNIVANLTDLEVTRLYYKNNFLAFIENRIVKDLLSEIVKYEFLEIPKPSKDLAPLLKIFWAMVKDYCVDVRIPRMRTKFCHTHIRKTVLTVDTDSNFLYNKPFTNKLRKFFPETLANYDNDKSIKLSCINLSMLTFTNLIAEGYDNMGRCLNIDDEHRPVINMKNEFAYERIMTTPAKKHYAGMLMAQEGVILQGSPERRLDMKGLNLRKSSLNKNIREYFTKTLIDKILLPKKINLSDIYKDFEEMENTIEKSLLNGDLDYCQPGKVNSIDKYAAPFTIQTLRGTLLWNALFPDNPIAPPNKVNYIKLKEYDYSTFIAKLPEDKKQQVSNLYSDPRMNNVSGKSLGEYNVNIICLPKNVTKLPDFLIDYVDTTVMVHDQIKAAMEILAPLGFKPLEVSINSKKRSYSTNIISV